VRSSLASITVGIVLSSWLASAQAQTYVSLGYGGAYEAWMLGFISSYNAYVFSGPNVVAGLVLDDLRKWVDDYCKEHAQENFDAVVRLLIDEHAKKNSQATR
jgi:hypothetical protein